MNRVVLAGDEIAAGLVGLDSWTHDDDRLRCQREFSDFSQAFAFMTRVAMIAEQLDHHPDWSNVYNTVVIEITTHDRGGVTEVDLEFARRVEQLKG